MAHIYKTLSIFWVIITDNRSFQRHIPQLAGAYERVLLIIVLSYDTVRYIREIWTSGKHDVSNFPFFFFSGVFSRQKWSLNASNLLLMLSIFFSAERAVR